MNSSAAAAVLLTVVFALTACISLAADGYGGDGSEEPSTCEITVSYDDNIETVTGQGTFGYGTIISLAAVAKPYHVVGDWSIGGSTIGNGDSISYTVGGDAEIFVSSAMEKDTGFTLTQTGFAEPFSFTCSDVFSPYSTDTWSTTGMCSDGGEEVLECKYREDSPGSWTLTVYGNSGRLADLRSVTITHTSSYPDDDTLSSYVDLDVYVWKNYSPIDLAYNEYAMFLELDEERYERSNDFSSDWNRAYGKMFRSMKLFDFIIIEDPTIGKIAENIGKITSEYPDEAGKVQCALDFVNFTIAYGFDGENYHTGEYFATAYETLCIRSGDCEDTSILFVSIAGYMGYDVYMMPMIVHMGGGVVIPGMDGGFEGYPGLLFCETTGDPGDRDGSWEVGDTSGLEEYIGDTTPVPVSVFSNRIIINL
jgi:hypothetical protein